MDLSLPIVSSEGQLAIRFTKTLNCTVCMTRIHSNLLSTGAIENQNKINVNLLLTASYYFDGSRQVYLETTAKRQQFRHSK